METLKVTHTPTPWRLSTGNSRYVVAEHGGIIATCEEVFDAEFIIHVVNAHDELLTAAKKVLIQIGQPAGIEDTTIFKKLTEAIAKAEGK